MRYKINFDRVVNQLVPHYIGGRKLILFLQSVLKPMQMLNDGFAEWATEVRIEASMTSQIFKFEWFLNRKFKKYFLSPNDRIFIQNSKGLGVPMYYESNDSAGKIDPILYSEEEGGDTMVLYGSTEKNVESGCSFSVSVPEVDESIITKKEYLSMIEFQIDKYRLANKTYTIIYNEAL